MLCYCTNIWNHHQGPVAVALAGLLGDANFRLLLYQPLDHVYSINRINLGWKIIPPDEPWIVGPPRSCSELDYTEHIKLVETADVLIFSASVPYITQKLLRHRCREGKLSMRMGERFYKIPLPWYYKFWPRKIAGRMLIRYRYKKAGLHFLTMGHGCAEDLDYLGVCRGRTWRWGYLTKTSSEFCPRIVSGKVRIGWCGRMIDWKHADHIIKAVACMPDEIRDRCQVILVGDGDQKDYLKELIERTGLSEIVFLRNAVDADKVLDFMRSLDIYIFPSDRQEGWGAALLEAMDAGCAVIANEDAGSTLEVLHSFKNPDGLEQIDPSRLPAGFTYRTGDIDSISRLCSWLVTHDDVRIAMGRRAWETIKVWSPDNGAKSLLFLIENIRSGRIPKTPGSGICELVR